MGNAFIVLFVYFSCTNPNIVLASEIKNIQHKDLYDELFLSDSSADMTKLQPNDNTMKQNTANKYPGFSKPPFTCTDSNANVRKLQSSENNTKMKRANSSSGSSKPPFTYNELIEQALQENGKLTVSGIYQWIS